MNKYCAGREYTRRCHRIFEADALCSPVRIGRCQALDCDNQKGRKFYRQCRCQKYQRDMNTGQLRNHGFDSLGNRDESKLSRLASNSDLKGMKPQHRYSHKYMPHQDRFSDNDKVHQGLDNARHPNKRP